MTTHEPGTSQASDRTAIAMAGFLWIVVICGLAYGVISTASKVVALFS